MVSKGEDGFQRAGIIKREETRERMESIGEPASSACPAAGAAGPLSRGFRAPSGLFLRGPLPAPVLLSDICVC